MDDSRKPTWHDDFKQKADAIAADVKLLVDEASFIIPPTRDGRPFLCTIEPMPIKALMTHERPMSSRVLYRPDHPTGFAAGSSVVVQSTERGGIAYLFVCDSCGPRREMWWRVVENDG